MLTRQRGGFVLALALTLLASVQPSSAAIAPICPPKSEYCIVKAEAPSRLGQPESPSQPVAGPSAVRACFARLLNSPVECQNAMFGWWSQVDECYYRLVEPQPVSTEPIWAGNYPNGAIYNAMCPGVVGTGGGGGWLATPPDGFGAVSTTPAELAQRAVDMMQLTGPAIGIAPPRGATGLVGLPVWLWTGVSATTWGPNTATASVPGLTVTATARAKNVVWDMGDGTKVTCTGPGTVYTKGRGGGASPTCGHVYHDSSAGQPDDAYPVTATTTWEVTWTGGGTSGTLTLTRASATTIRIGELQVLVT
jgi:hypothetical protein